MIYENEVREQAGKLLSTFSSVGEKDFWNQSRKRVLEHLVKHDLNTFHHWPVLRETMIVYNTDYVYKEYSEIVSAPGADRWQNVFVENLVGSPVAAPFLRSTSENLLHHCYHVFKFETTTDKKVNSFGSILEFGGGYGSMCRVVNKLGFSGNYVIFDLPEFTLLQKFFLRNVGFTVCESYEEYKKNGGIYCTSNISELDESYDLMIATWSISEVPLELREKIFGKDIKNFLVAFQDTFFDINNNEYFTDLMVRKNKQWNTWKISHLYGEQFYLMGYEK